MKKTAVTLQVLEMLLENWGLFVTSGNWGPKVATQCGSAERAYSAIRGGYEQSKLTTQADDVLGEMLERIIRELPIDYVNILVCAYGYKRVILGAYNNAILDSAKISIHEKLEVLGYAR